MKLGGEDGGKSRRCSGSGGTADGHDVILEDRCNWGDSITWDKGPMV